MKMSQLCVYLICASLLVMASPTLDNAADVTWPAWERLSCVLTYLWEKRKMYWPNRSVSFAVYYITSEHIQKTNIHPDTQLTIGLYSQCSLSIWLQSSKNKLIRLVMVGPVFITTPCAKSGCVAINRAPILFDLDNPITVFLEGIPCVQGKPLRKQLIFWSIW